VQIFLRDLRAGLIHALEAEEGIIGLVVLGQKKNLAPFTAEDLTFLHALGQISNVALYSAKLDGEITRLNEELRLKMEKISEQQRQMAVLQSEITSRQVDDVFVERKPPQPDEFRRDVVIGNSAAIQRVLATVRKVANSESSVVLRGESGTGKELLAEILHYNSPRRAGPLVSVHCASLSPSLLESELFGHVKGSFTGAHRDRVGRFEMASGGTLFLDEIGDISLETQIKLLRVLQERSFEPVGGSRTVQVDVRLITATHQNLEKLIAEHRFREDLYYRLNVISVTLPPLRERREDIIELAVHFLGLATRQVGKRVTRFRDEVLVALERYNWPGNVRELENAIERAVVLADGEEITLRDLPIEIQSAVSAPSTSASAPSPQTARRPRQVPPPYVGSVARSLPDFDDDVERTMLERALIDCRGNKAEAARKLGMPRSTFFSKLKKYQLDKLDPAVLQQKREPDTLFTMHGPTAVSSSDRARFQDEATEELRKLEEQLKNINFERLAGEPPDVRDA
jgi:transcriptional regulator with GAF, ATPase, and Fis domain